MSTLTLQTLCLARLPLWGPWNRRGGVVKLLLERKDADTNSLGKSGQMPLTLAAGDGHGR